MYHPFTAREGFSLILSCLQSVCYGNIVQSQHARMGCEYTFIWSPVITRKSWMITVFWQIPCTPSIPQNWSPPHNSSLMYRGLLVGPRSVTAGQTEQSFWSPPIVVSQGPEIVVIGYGESESEIVFLLPNLLLFLPFPLLLGWLPSPVMSSILVAFNVVNVEVVRRCPFRNFLITECKFTKLGKRLASVAVNAMYFGLLYPIGPGDLPKCRKVLINVTSSVGISIMSIILQRSRSTTGNKSERGSI